MRLTMVVPDLPIVLNEALEGLTRVSAVMLVAALVNGTPVPPMYTTGLRYKREPKGREWWQTVADNHHDKEADCEDLATNRAAELRVGPLLALAYQYGGIIQALVALGASTEGGVLDLGPARELIVGGDLYGARAICVRTGPKTYHAIVEHPDGTREDPSRALGMKVPRRRH